MQLMLLSNAAAQRQVEKVLGSFGMAVCVYRFEGLYLDFIHAYHVYFISYIVMYHINIRNYI